jgi:UMF1 family MFS transporter
MKEETSFFFYDVVEKVSILFGTFAFGFIEQITGSMRNSIIALGIFFVVGLFLLNSADLKISKKFN